MTKPKIGLILSTTRETRFADHPAKWLMDIIAARGDFDAEIIDLRDHPLPFFEEARSPAYGSPDSAVARAWSGRIAALDGFIFVTAEYNRSIPGVLKNALDYAYSEWNRKPAACVGYGPLGAARAVEQLRLMLIELQIAPTRTGVHITMDPYLKVLTEGVPLADFGYLNDSAKAMLDELAWWTEALRAARDTAAARAA